MKIRKDFVTNSSSSSFICVAKINNTDDLFEYMEEEYGRYGIRLLEKYLVTGKEIKEDDNFDFEEFLDYCNKEKLDINDTDIYLQASFIEWSTDGESNEDDAWLYDHIPCKYKEEICKTSGY